jgi:hypothetical protein
MDIYWGTKGFSLRLKSKTGKILSLFYGLPPGSNGRDVAYIQGYVGYIEDENTRANIRRLFLSIEGTTPRGEYTVDLELSPKTLEAAKQLVEVLWEVKTQFER